MNNSLYTLEMCGEILEKGEQYEMVIITHWSNRTDTARELGRRAAYIKNKALDVKKYFSNESTLEDFYNSYEQFTRFCIEDGPSLIKLGA